MILGSLAPGDGLPCELHSSCLDDPVIAYLLSDLSSIHTDRIFFSFCSLHPLFILIFLFQLRAIFVMSPLPRPSIRTVPRSATRPPLSAPHAFASPCFHRMLPLPLPAGNLFLAHSPTSLHRIASNYHIVTCSFTAPYIYESCFLCKKIVCHFILIRLSIVIVNLTC